MNRLMTLRKVGVTFTLVWSLNSFLKAQSCGSINAANGLVINLADPNGCNCSGSYAFYDDGGPSGNYSNNRRDTVRFVSPGRRLRIRFNSSSLQTCCDHLWVYDGNVTPGGPIRAGLMWRLNGSTSPASLISTQDTVTFIFYSDGSTTNAGWSALIDCVPPGAGGTLTRYDLSDGSPSSSVSCGTLMSFYDRGGPHNVYPEAVDDTVTFIPANPTDRLMVAFPYQLSLSSGDTLWVYENTMTPNNLLALFTAGSSRAETLLTTASGNNLIFHFRSDFDGNVGPGWGAVISCAPPSPPSPTTYMGRGVRTIACGTTYRFYDSGSPGLIADNGRSSYGNYADNENNTITFVSQNQAQRLRLDFSSFSTQSNFDWLEVYDGSTTTSPLIGRWSGGTLPPIILSSGPMLTIRFSSDGSNNSSGWVATVQCAGLPAPPTYTMSNATQSVTTCSALFYDDGGPAGGYTYPQDRTFTFCPDDPTAYLRVRFPYQFVLAAGDTLWAYEGPSVDPARLLGIYVRGNKGEEIALQVPGTCLTFRFKADAASPGAAGWHGIVECTSTPQPSITWMQGRGIRRQCNLILYDDGGPNANYRNNANDSLLLISPSSCGVSIQFTQFTTETNIDLLSLWQISSSGSSSVGSFSGSSLPNSGNPINPGGDSLLLRFTSNGSNNAAGWRAVVSCPNSFSVSVSPANAVLCRGGSVTLTASGGPAGTTYTWNTGATGSTLVVTSPGTYWVTAQAPSGCTAYTNPAVVTPHSPADTTISISDATLSNTTCQNPGYNCTWYDCNTNQVVGTGSAFTPTSSGWYALIIENTATNCRDTSNCHYIGTNSIMPPFSSADLLRLYPNPTFSTSRLEAAAVIEVLRIWDTQGREVFSTWPRASFYDLPSLPAGTYKVQVMLFGGTPASLTWQVVK
jgi:hypothetical protein